MMPFLETIQERLHQTGRPLHDKVPVLHIDEGKWGADEDSGAIFTVYPTVEALVECNDETRGFAAALAAQLGFPAKQQFKYAQSTELREANLEPEYVLVSLNCGFASPMNEPSPERTQKSLEEWELTARNAEAMQPTIIIWETTAGLLKEPNDNIRRMLEEIIRSPEGSEPLYDYRLFSICPKTHVGGYESRRRAIYIGLCRDRTDYGFGRVNVDNSKSVRNGASAPMWPGDAELAEMLEGTGTKVSKFIEKRSPDLPSRRL